MGTRLVKSSLIDVITIMEYQLRLFLVQELPDSTRVLSTYLLKKEGLSI